MRRESFDMLLNLIRDKLEADHDQAARRGGVIMPEIRLYSSQEKSKKTFRFDMLQKRRMTPLQYWLSDGTDWPALKEIAR
jgi:hypothetical protein